MSEKKKPKPIKIEFERNLISFSNESPISIQKSKIINETTPKKSFSEISGNVQIRKETKGRAGKPVIILYNFSDMESKNTESLKKLCSKLKETLACGGTIENNEIILTSRNIEKIKETLLKLNINSK